MYRKRWSSCIWINNCSTVPPTGAYFWKFRIVHMAYDWCVQIGIEQIGNFLQSYSLRGDGFRYGPGPTDTTDKREVFKTNDIVLMTLKENILSFKTNGNNPILFENIESEEAICFDNDDSMMMKQNGFKMMVSLMLKGDSIQLLDFGYLSKCQGTDKANNTNMKELNKLCEQETEPKYLDDVKEEKKEHTEDVPSVNEEELEVKEWLFNEVKLGQYYELFIDEGYDSMIAIKELTVDDLDFINKRGH
eukprot:61163_1